VALTFYRRKRLISSGLSAVGRQCLSEWVSPIYRRDQFIRLNNYIFIGRASPFTRCQQWPSVTDVTSKANSPTLSGKSSPAMWKPGDRSFDPMFCHLLNCCDNPRLCPNNRVGHRRRLFPSRILSNRAQEPEMRGTMGYCHNASVRKDCFVNEHLN